MTQPLSICAAILADKGGPVDLLVEKLVKDLREDGFRVAGVIQRMEMSGDTCCAAMGLELLSTGETVGISQPLGNGSSGCRLDPAGLAEATARLLRDLETGPDLLILNRFGKGEQDGQGFRQVIARAVDLNIHVLTAVRPTYLPDWRAFTGELAVELPADFGEVRLWCNRVLQDRAREAAHG